MDVNECKIESNSVDNDWYAYDWFICFYIFIVHSALLCNLFVSSERFSFVLILTTSVFSAFMASYEVRIWSWGVILIRVVR